MTSSESPPAGVRPDLVDSPYAWFRLVISMALGTIGGVGFWAVVIILPTVQAEFGVDRAGASLPYAMTMAGFAIGNVLVGRFVDRLGITLPVVAATLALGAGYMAAAATDAIWQFALIHGVLIGVGTSAIFGPLIADVSHWFHRRRGIAVAATASGNYLAGAIWPPIIQAFVESDGWRATYFGIGVICVATMVPLALTLRRPPPKQDSVGVISAAPGRAAMFSPRRLQILLAVAGVGCCVAMSMPQVHIVAYSVDLGYGAIRGAEMLSLMLAGGVVSRLLSGYLADLFGGVRMLLLGSLLQCAALFLYLPFEGLTALYAVSLIFGLAQGGIIPSYAIVVREFLPAREAAHRIGIVIMATIVGMSLGGWLSGWIFDQTGSYHAAFLNGIGWNLLNLSIIGMIFWRSRPRAPVVA